MVLETTKQVALLHGKKTEGNQSHLQLNKSDNVRASVDQDYLVQHNIASRHNQVLLKNAYAEYQGSQYRKGHFKVLQRGAIFALTDALKSI